jgi:hypothetical protein
LTLPNREFSAASQRDMSKQHSSTTSAEVGDVLQHGPRGAMLIAGVAVAILFLGWLLFYFVLFMRRGYVG